ncbi:hypothetical protein G7Y89_g11709 [Cudoniella acicularis]|uniref:Zn(2)-C6 fungal-type domain-containing protein n=1 Tax=Cudoniella acicularis TaxID=354080 RepID=A0A8H4RBH7_9HELO|nr:hypothetical protein G7Y89_g11709 [Cudoniella acicularis]
MRKFKTGAELGTGLATNETLLAMEGVNPELVKLPADQPRKRRRPALSCAECRRRKIKCDRNLPCGPCRVSKSATCTYSPEVLSSFKGHVSTAPSTSISGGNTAQALNETSFTNFSSPLNSSNIDLTLEHTPPSPGRSSSGSHHSESGHVVQALIDRVGRLEQLLTSASITDSTHNSNVGKIPTKDARGNMSKTRFFGHSHWMHAFAQARKMMCFEININGYDDIKLKNPEADLELKDLINECKAMARVIKAAQAPQWSLWGLNCQHSMPSRAVADGLVENYFRTHESVHRILHIPSFQKEYNQYWNNPDVVPMVSVIKIILVMAIGVCFYQGPDFDSHRKQAMQWIYTAQSWLSSPNEKGRLHTACLQVECLVLLARSIFHIGADMTWNSTGTLIRTAMSMGLHLDPKHFNRFSVLHGEVRRRLWATILELNIQSSTSSGMPPMISEHDFDTEPPLNINDEDIDESTTAYPTPKPKDVFTQCSLQIALLNSHPKRSEVAKIVNNFRFEPSYDQVIRLSKEILTDYKGNYGFLSRVVQDPNVKFKPTAFQRKILDVMTQRFLLALHRPFAMKARSDPRFYYSYKVYLDTAMSMLSRSTPDFPPSPFSDDAGIEDDYGRYRMVSGGFLKEVLIHSVIIIYLEMLIPLEEDPSTAFIQERKPSREPFHRLLQEMSDLSLKRIELGETNVKAHFMFAISLGHVSALENGTSSDEGIIEAGRKGIEKCRDILKSRMPPPVETQQPQFSDGISGLAATSDLQGGIVDFSMPDWGMAFEPADSWLFPNWIDTEMQ